MSKQNIHIAMGSLAYAIAKADGQIQNEEKELIKKLAQEEFEMGDSDMELIRKMFTSLETDNISLEDAYKYAIDTLESNRYEFDFDSSMKAKCLRFMSRTADAVEGTSAFEQSVIDRFKKDLANF